MDKPENKYSKNAKYSLKSNICDTLHARYGRGQAQQLRSTKNRVDF